MESELAALAASAAATLTGLLMTDGWAQAKTRLGTLFAHTSQGRQLGAEIEATRSALLTAAATQNTRIPAELRADWEGRFRHLLREDPQAQTELRTLLAALAQANQLHGPGLTVHNSISGGTLHGSVIQAGTVAAPGPVQAEPAHSGDRMRANTP